MHTERRLTLLGDNITYSDDSDTNESMHTTVVLLEVKSKLCADKPMPMQPPRTCPLNDENADTKGAILLEKLAEVRPTETPRKRRGATKRTASKAQRLLPPPPRCNSSSCLSSCKKTAHMLEDANNADVVAACFRGSCNCACIRSGQLASPTRVSRRHAMFDLLLFHVSLV